MLATRRLSDIKRILFGKLLITRLLNGKHPIEEEMASHRLKTSNFLPFRYLIDVSQWCGEVAIDDRDIPD